MKKKVIVISSIVLGLAVISYFLFFKSDPAAANYSFATVNRGDLNVIISSTGTIQAVKTVDVGTQVSGRIDKLLVDFNSSVKEGQLLAVLDTVVLAATVRDAQASLDKARALYDQAVAIHERNIKLYEKNFMNEVDFIASKTNVQSLLASQKSAVTALERAKLNRNYAFIRAPISGTIINRAVEQGQTVASSLSAPVIFTIAKDLSSMRILANVDESDIGQIKLGVKVRFTVQAYQSRYFDGEVTEIRLNPTVVSNVVNYTVVVSAVNKDRVLLPGMTATVDFYVDFREKVLLVPNVALRFTPSDAQMEEYKKNMEKEMANAPDSVKKRFQAQNQPQGQNGNGTGQTGGNAQGGTKRRSNNKLWYLDENTKLKMSPVTIGLTDGKNTEIVKGRNITEGMKVITGVLEGKAATTGGSSVFTPAAPQGQQRPGGSRGF